MLLRKFGFWSILGPQKSRQNSQLAFEMGQQVNLGARVPSPNVEPPLMIVMVMMLVLSL